MKKAVLIIIFFIGFFGYSQKNSFVVIGDFSIELPGKWKHTKDNQGIQFGFENKTVGGFLIISVREAKKIEFYKPEFSNLSDYELLNQFYKWDYDYWNENSKNQVTEIEKSEINKLIIWKIFPPMKDSSFNYRLDGIQKGYIISINYVNEKMEEKQKIDLIKNIYQNIKYSK